MASVTQRQKPALLRAMSNGFTPSDAAKAMDLDDLPVNTYVRFSTNKGYSGWQRNTGLITSVTEQSYVVKLSYGDTSRLNRKSAKNRGLAVLMTPDEYAAGLIERDEYNAAVSAEFAAREAATKREQRDKQARQRAYEMLAVNHPAEFTRHKEAALKDIEQQERTLA